MPADTGAIFSDQPYINDPGPLSIKVIEFLYNSPVVAKTLDYGKKTLHAETFNHFMMVYYYGTLPSSCMIRPIPHTLLAGHKGINISGQRFYNVPPLLTLRPEFQLACCMI